MNASLARRLAAVEAARAAYAQRLARPMSDLDMASRLASLFNIGHPRVVALTANARWFVEIAGEVTPTQPQAQSTSPSAEIRAALVAQATERASAEARARLGPRIAPPANDGIPLSRRNVRAAEAWLALHGVRA